MPHEYNQSDAEDILKRAVAIDALQSHNKEVLFKTAEELGISRQAVEQAEFEHFKQKKEQEEMKEFIAHERASFWQHLGAYLIINTFLLFIDLNKDGNLDFVLYSLGGWGIGLAFHAMSTFTTCGDDFQQEFEEWKAKRQKTT